MKVLSLGWLMLALSLPGAGWAAVQGEAVEYRDGDTVMKGFIAYDDAVKGKRPGVLVVHEWWGHNDHARNSARKLAKLGYTALAVDMYGDGKTADHPKTAGAFAGEVKSNMAVAEARFRAAMKLLHAHASTDATKTAAIGYCFGGSMVLEMARRGVDLDAVASFHGSLGTGTPAQAGKVKARLFVANGADDPFVKAEQIAAFKAEMDAVGANYEFVNYPGAKHSFTNPGADANGAKFNLPLQYNAEADKASWAKMRDMLARVFK